MSIEVTGVWTGKNEKFFFRLFRCKIALEIECAWLESRSTSEKKVKKFYRTNARHLEGQCPSTDRRLYGKKWKFFFSSIFHIFICKMVLEIEYDPPYHHPTPSVRVRVRPSVRVRVIRKTLVNFFFRWKAHSGPPDPPSLGLGFIRKTLGKFFFPLKGPLTLRKTLGEFFFPLKGHWLSKIPTLMAK